MFVGVESVAHRTALERALGSSDLQCHDSGTPAEESACANSHATPPQGHRAITLQLTLQFTAG
jgi:hypothetical protein